MSSFFFGKLKLDRLTRCFGVNDHEAMNVCFWGKFLRLFSCVYGWNFMVCLVDGKEGNMSSHHHQWMWGMRERREKVARFDACVNKSNEDNNDGERFERSCLALDRNLEVHGMRWVRVKSYITRSVSNWKFIFEICQKVFKSLIEVNETHKYDPEFESIVLQKSLALSFWFFLQKFFLKLQHVHT